MKRVGLSPECQELLDLGYSKTLAKKALIINKNDLEGALDYLRENYPDPVLMAEEQKGKKKKGAVGSLFAPSRRSAARKESG